jgi:hypothetical protein
MPFSPRVGRIIFGVLLLLSPAAPGQAASVAEWRQDLDRIAAHIRSIHPDPFAKVGEMSFRRRAEALKEALPGLTEEQRVVEAMRLVASLGDGHTQLQPDRPDFGAWYPIRLYEFSDGYFITSAHQSVLELAGAQVLQIGDVPVAEAVSRARELMGADNLFDSREKLFAVHSAALMKGLGLATERCRCRPGSRMEEW